MSACQGCQGTLVRTKHAEVDWVATEAEVEAISWILARFYRLKGEVMRTVEDIRDLARMHGGRGHTPSSETLSRLSECGQSAYERDEIAPLPPALNPLSFGVTLADVLEAGISRGF